MRLYVSLLLVSAVIAACFFAIRYERNFTIHALRYERNYTMVEFKKLIGGFEVPSRKWQQSTRTKRLPCVSWLGGNNVSRAQYKRTYAILDALAAEQIPASLFYGSLLGAYRHHGSIPFAKGEDVDIAVFSKSWEQVLDILDDLGFHYTIQFNGVYIHGNYFGKYGVDLWIYEVGTTVDGKKVGQCRGPPHSFFWDLIESNSTKLVVPAIFEAIKNLGATRRNSPEVVCKLWYRAWGASNGEKTWEEDRFPMEQWFPPSRLLFGYSIVPVILEYEKYIKFYFPEDIYKYCGRNKEPCRIFTPSYPFVSRNTSESGTVEKLSIMNQEPIHTIKIFPEELMSNENPGVSVVAKVASCAT